MSDVDAKELISEAPSPSDLVRRLRNHVNNRGGASLQNGAWQMMLEAAAEIELLRAALRLAAKEIAS